MTRTSTHSGARRTTWAERAFVLGGLAIAALGSAASLASGAGAEPVAPLWLAAIAWTVLASLAGALSRGLRHGDWSAFGRYRLPDERGELVDWTTKTGRYAHHRVADEHHRLMHDDGALLGGDGAAH